MNMNKKLREFFSLTRRANAGFTLVELIVVIAILAILAGVAIPVYSGYIKKANMQADMTLVSDVAHALSLYYYSNPHDEASGFVVLTPEGQDCKSDGVVGDVAMLAVFGEGWKQNLSLKYGEWDNGMTDLLAAYDSDTLGLINNSSYLTNSTADSLMVAVNKMTNLASTVIGDKNMTDEKIESNLKLVLGDTAETAEIIKTLKDNSLLNNSTAISNMLVGAMADSLGSNEALQRIVNDYAAAFAYGEKTGNYEAYNKMTENLANVNMASLTDKKAATKMLWAGFFDENDPNYSKYAEFDKYTTDNSAQLDKDEKALAAMMGAVKEITGNFQDKESLTDVDLFTSSDMMNQVTGYFNSVEALAGMDENTLAILKNLPAGAVAVLITADGAVAVTPSDAWAA